jgi:AcrR family transcriptional regulator
MGDGAMTRERILAEALDVFSQHGFEGARMEMIAAQVGINKASLYFHFKSKEELFRGLFRTIADKYASNIRRITNQTADVTLEKRLTVIFQDYLKYDWDNAEIDFWNRVFYSPPQMMREEVYQRTFEIESEFLTKLITIFEDGIRRNEIRPFDPQRMAKTFYYLLTGVSISVVSKAEAYGDMESCFAVFWDGIKR